MQQHADRLPGVLSTFGFGYQADSVLLRELAVCGGGMYSFIPDSGFVGTAFCHALANTLVAAGTHAKLAVTTVRCRFVENARLRLCLFRRNHAEHVVFFPLHGRFFLLWRF